MKYFASGVLALSLLCVGSGIAQPGFAADAQARNYVLGIEGMSCPVGCVPMVQGILENIDGVVSAEVNFEKRSATVVMDAGAVLTQEICDKAFGNSGYSVSNVEVAAGDGG